MELYKDGFNNSPEAAPTFHPRVQTFVGKNSSLNHIVHCGPVPHSSRCPIYFYCNYLYNSCISIVGLLALIVNGFGVISKENCNFSRRCIMKLFKLIVILFLLTSGIILTNCGDGRIHFDKPTTPGDTTSPTVNITTSP